MAELLRFALEELAAASVRKGRKALKASQAIKEYRVLARRGFAARQVSKGRRAFKATKGFKASRVYKELKVRLGHKEMQALKGI